MMEGGLKYTRNGFTCIVKRMDGLVSLVLHCTAKLKVLPQAWWVYGRVQNCSIPWLPRYPSGICAFPSLVRLPGQHGHMIPLAVGLPDYSGTDS